MPAVSDGSGEHPSARPIRDQLSETHMKPLWPRPVAWLLVAALSALIACQATAPGDHPQVAAGPDVSPISLFIEPRDGSGPIVEAIASARSSIRIKAYLLTSSDIIGALQAGADCQQQVVWLKGLSQILVGS